MTVPEAPAGQSPREREILVDSMETGAPERAASVRSAEDAALATMPDPAVAAALRALPGHLRTAVYLADVEGCTYAEVAAYMGVPLGTVMSRLHRGRKRLRARLAAAEDAGIRLTRAGHPARLAAALVRVSRSRPAAGETKSAKTA